MLLQQPCDIYEIVVCDANILLEQLKSELKSHVANLKCLNVQCILNDVDIMFSWAKSSDFPFVEFQFFVHPNLDCLESVFYIMNTPGLAIERLHLDFRKVSNLVANETCDLLITSENPCYLSDIRVSIVDPSIRRLVEGFSNKLKIQRLFLFMVVAKNQQNGMLRKLPIELIRLTSTFLV
jgi:hypothetical protein